jgi:hypothetical protein
LALAGIGIGAALGLITTWCVVAGIAFGNGVAFRVASARTERRLVAAP